MSSDAPLDRTQQELVEQHYRYIFRVAVRVDPDPNHRDEVVSLAYLLLCQSAQRYEAGRGVPFKTYASKLTEKAVRGQRNRRWALRYRNVPLETDPPEHRVETGPDREDLERLRELIRVTPLTDCERTALEVYLRGENGGYAASVMGGSRQWANQALHKAIDKLKLYAGQI